jgi:ferredoxin
VTAPDETRAVHGLRIAIDRTLCVGFGDCVTAAPSAFALDEENVVVFTAPETATREELLKACGECPVDALTVWDSFGVQLVPAVPDGGTRELGPGTREGA